MANTKVDNPYNFNPEQDYIASSEILETPIYKKYTLTAGSYNNGIQCYGYAIYYEYPNPIVSPSQLMDQYLQIIFLEILILTV
mgnify:CR=1 FL=1